MLEHIFRNINDIRVFDYFYIENFDGEEVDIDDIIKGLEYKEIESNFPYYRIAVNNLTTHLSQAFYKKGE